MPNSEQIIGCPNCGTENIFNGNRQDKLYCQECGKDLTKYVIIEDNAQTMETISEKNGISQCEETDFRQTFSHTDNTGDFLECIKPLGYIIKLLLFICVPSYFLYMGYNIIFKTTETLSNYGVDYILLNESIVLKIFNFGVGAFLLIFFWISIIYAEIILNKFTNLNEKIEKLNRRSTNTDIQEKKAINVLNCSKCGKTYQLGDKFCEECGTKLD